MKTLRWRHAGNSGMKSSALDIEIDRFFQFGERFKKLRRLRIGLQIKIDGGLAPTVKHRGAAAGEINAPGPADALAQSGHEFLDFCPIAFSAHLKVILHRRRSRVLSTITWARRLFGRALRNAGRRAVNRAKDPP